MLRVKDVSKRFYQGDGPDYIDALKDISFHAHENELVMIVGPSGCGKTTLLSVIAGTLRADKGTIDVLGINLEGLNDEETTAFRRINVGFIFQQFHLIKTLSLIENVSVPMLLNGFNRVEAEEKAAEMLERVGLKGREYEFPKKLSGGQQQRVAIARALIHNPPLIICDEPTSALDAETGIRIMELLKEISHQAGRCVVVVTHDNRIFKYADRMAQMDDGKIIRVGKDHEIF